jgi:hypothetical protein
MKREFCDICQKDIEKEIKDRTYCRVSLDPSIAYALCKECGDKLCKVFDSIVKKFQGQGEIGPC